MSTALQPGIIRLPTTVRQNAAQLDHMRLQSQCYNVTGLSDLTVHESVRTPVQVGPLLQTWHCTARVGRTPKCSDIDAMGIKRVKLTRDNE